MAHHIMNFEHLIGEVKGLSENQLRNHFELYQGYVERLNEIEEAQKSADWSKANYSYSTVSELKRRHSVAYNGAYLHQLYFENLTGQSTTPSPSLDKAINNTFGSMTNWLSDVLAGLKTADGWVLFTRSLLDNTLHNCVIEEHHRGLLVGQEILLAIDGWEHAYMIDYGIKKADYFKSIQHSLNWNVASQRFQNSQQNISVAA